MIQYFEYHFPYNISPGRTFTLLSNCISLIGRKPLKNNEIKNYSQIDYLINQNESKLTISKNISQSNKFFSINNQKLDLNSINLSDIITDPSQISHSTKYDLNSYNLNNYKNEIKLNTEFPNKLEKNSTYEYIQYIQLVNWATYVSRSHCYIQIENSLTTNLVIISQNGLFINHKKYQSDDKISLNHGDSFYFPTVNSHTLIGFIFMKTGSQEYSCNKIFQDFVLNYLSLHFDNKCFLNEKSLDESNEKEIIMKNSSESIVSDIFKLSTNHTLLNHPQSQYDEDIDIIQMNLSRRSKLKEADKFKQFFNSDNFLSSSFECDKPIMNSDISEFLSISDNKSFESLLKSDFKIDNGLKTEYKNTFINPLSKKYDMKIKECEEDRYLNYKTLTHDPKLMEILENSQPKSTLLLSNEDTNCVICSELVTEIYEIGYLETCKHYFCFDCIKKWADVTNLCPLCKNEFFFIKKIYKDKDQLNYSELVSVTQKSIEMNTNINNEDIFEDYGGCEICGMDNEWNKLLLCDTCDKGYHIFCLNPPLDTIPSGNWYCPSCSNSISNSSTSSSSAIFDATTENNLSNLYRPLEFLNTFQVSNSSSKYSFKNSSQTRKTYGRSFKQCLMDQSLLQFLNYRSNRQLAVNCNNLNTNSKPNRNNKIRNNLKNYSQKFNKVRKRNRRFPSSSSENSEINSIFIDSQFEE